MTDIAGTKLYFSGVESRRLLDTFEQFAVPYCQVSYYYLRKVFSKPEDFDLHAKNFQGIVIDSGLVFHKYKSEPEKKEFLEAYYEYVAALNPKHYDAIVTHLDLPLDKVIDEEKLIYPLEDLEDLFEGDIKSIFSNVEYIGVSNKVVNQEDRMSVLASQATKHGVKLHTFGTASQSILKKWPIYSSNTSSWRTGSRYANTYVYEGPGRGLKLFQPTDKTDIAKTDREKTNFRSRQKNFVETRQPHLYEKIDWDSLLQDDDSWEVDKANLSQWILYQHDLALEGRQAYWLTEEEKKELYERKKERGFTVSGKSGPTNREDPLPSVRQTEEIVNAEVVNESNLPAITGGRLRDVDSRLLQPRMCDTCILANRCPKYEPGATCAFGLSESYDPINVDGHITEDVGDLLALQKDRIMQGYLEEKADGSGLNKDLNREIKTYLEMVNLYKTATDQRDEISLKAKGTGLIEMFSKKR